MAVKLKTAQRVAALKQLDGWKKVRGREAIEKTFVFNDFNEAFGWMTRVAMLAEEIGHHPEWSNIYKTVNVVLATHDAGGITELDLRMAQAMNAMT